MALQTLENQKMAILFGDDTTPHVVNKTINKRMMHYKSAASYAVKIIKNPKNYDVIESVVNPTEIRWKHNVEIVDNNHVPVAWSRRWTETDQWDTVIEGSPVYPAVKYILTAIRNAKNEVIADVLGS